MRIDGAGGCFDNRLYEVDIDVAGILPCCASMRWV